MPCLNHFFHLPLSCPNTLPPKKGSYVQHGQQTQKVWNHLCDVRHFCVWASLTALHIYYWTGYTLLTAHSNELTQWRPFFQHLVLPILGPRISIIIVVNIFNFTLHHLMSAVLHLWGIVDSQPSDCLRDSSAPGGLGEGHENWICCTPWICRDDGSNSILWFKIMCRGTFENF